MRKVAKGESTFTEHKSLSQVRSNTVVLENGEEWHMSRVALAGGKSVDDEVSVKSYTNYWWLNAEEPSPIVNEENEK